MPLTFDFPLKQLKVYTGTNPRPDDFDDFWDSALSEMKAVEPEIEMIPADFKTSFCECQELYFTGVGGARIHARLLCPTGLKAPQPAVLMCRGLASTLAQASAKGHEWTVLVDLPPRRGMLPAPSTVATSAATPSRRCVDRAPRAGWSGCRRPTHPWPRCASGRRPARRPRNPRPGCRSTPAGS